MRLVIWTESAVVGASFNRLSAWVQHTLADFAVFLKSLEELVVRPVDIFEMTVTGAVFCNDDLSIFFHNFGVKSFETFWTKTGSVLYNVGLSFPLLLLKRLQFDTTIGCNVFNYEEFDTLYKKVSKPFLR